MYIIIYKWDSWCENYSAYFTFHQKKTHESVFNRATIKMISNIKLLGKLVLELILSLQYTWYKYNMLTSPCIFTYPVLHAAWLQLKEETGSAPAPQCWKNILEAEHTSYAERDVPMLNVTGKWWQSLAGTQSTYTLICVLPDCYVLCSRMCSPSSTRPIDQFWSVLGQRHRRLLRKKAGSEYGV